MQPDHWDEETEITDDLLDEWEMEAIHEPRRWPALVALALIREVKRLRKQLAGTKEATEETERAVQPESPESTKRDDGQLFELLKHPSRGSAP